MKIGLEAFLAGDLRRAVGRRAGLITNHTGVDQHLRSSVELLRAADGIELVALFAPEHGLWGEAQAGVEVCGHVDRRTGLPVYSLYGEMHRPTPDTLEGLDVVIFDIQDLGVRYATRLTIMAQAQEAAASVGIDFMVFDRPNPISGVRVEGNLLEPGFASLIGCHPIPVRHGMTVGELARLFAAERRWPEPIVVPMEGWRREWWFDETGLPWVPPSPNLPTLDSVTLYPGTCLLEGTNLSEGRGSTRPFEIVGAPWLDPFEVVKELEGRHLTGVAFRPTYFTPTFSKHMDTMCGGVQVHILDRNAARPVEVGIHLLHAMRTLSGDAFEWRQRVDGRYKVDLLSGSDRLRKAFDEGAEAGDLLAGSAHQARAFENRRRPFLLYG
ncbi:MAG: DUF1343 domain-containing protein [Chloroflexota bacterium]|nr:DUF1343 domain-containing protein [Chloroflexota bacterium]